MLRSSPEVTPSSSRSAVPSSERPLVLVVDPDRSARAVLEVALARDGFDVWTVESAEQGLGVLRRGRTPDVIVLESDLSGGDGFSFCAELRGNQKTARVPVVLLARPDDENVGNLAEVVGVDEYVQKPAFARDVAALVRFELVRHRATVGQPLRFHTKNLPASHLLRALLTSARAGTLSLADGQASLSFRDGTIVQAQFGQRWGIDAVVRGLALTFADYTVTLAPVSVSTGFQCGLRDYVGQVLPRLTRWSSLVMRSLPLDAVLAVDFARLAQSLPSMPDDVNRIVQLFDGRRRVQQVLVDSAFDEVLTLEVGTRLYLMGVIGPVATEQDEALEPKQAPRLFEPRSAEAEDLMRQLFDGSVEIRSSDVEPAMVDEDDWTVVGASSDLEVEDPAGGWTAAALPDAHFTDGLEADVAAKLNAFNVPTVVEPQEPPVEHQPVADFADGQIVAEGGSMEGALRAVTGDETAALKDLEPAKVPDEDPTPPSSTRRFVLAQERIVTPLLTPVVELAPLAEATHALTIEGNVVSTVPEQVAAIAAPPVTVASSAVTVAPPAVTVASSAVTIAPSADHLETAFFSAPHDADASAFEDTLPTHAAPLAKSKSRVGLLVGLGVAAVLVTVAGEWLIDAAPRVTPEVAQAALVAPAPAPVVAPVPAPPVLEPVEIAAEPAPAVEVIDVSEPLADGVRAYQAGEYQKAVAVLEQVVADDPNSLQGWLVLGEARYDAGNTSGAKEAAARVLELDAKNAKVHLLLATIAHDAADKATMRAEVEKYLELAPNGEHAAEAKALLR